MTGFKSQPTVWANGIPVRAANEISRRDGWYLSYDRSVSWYGCQTTALVLQGRVFLILSGDHRTAWDTAANEGGLTGALEYFIAHDGDAHRLSEHMMALGLVNDPFELAATLEAMVSPGLLAAMRHHFEVKA